jgi:hypothetical protein
VRVESKVSAQMNSPALILPFILKHRDRGSLGRLWEGHGKGVERAFMGWGIKDVPLLFPFYFSRDLLAKFGPTIPMFSSSPSR